MKAPRFRSRTSYANVTSTLALALALSTGGAYAAAQIGAGDIKDDAVRTRHIADANVTRTDIKDGAVTRAKLAPNAQTQVIEYRLGPHNFATADVAPCVGLSGLTRAQVLGSVWTAQLQGTFVYGPSVIDDLVYPVPGEGVSGTSRYRVDVQTGFFDQACVRLVSGPGEAYDAVRLIRTIPTTTITP